MRLFELIHVHTTYDFMETDIIGIYKITVSKSFILKPIPPFLLYFRCKLCASVQGCFYDRQFTKFGESYSDPASKSHDIGFFLQMCVFIQPPVDNEAL